MAKTSLQIEDKPKRKKKEPRPIIDHFSLSTTTILSTKQCIVVANTSEFGLVKGKEYTCLRKCITATHNKIFEIVTEDGEIKTFGNIWFEPVND